MAERVVIRSYRRVFEVDRRIYRVDRWALPVPGGVPLRAVGYFAATVLAVVVLGALPGTGELVDVLSPPLRYVVLPLAVAVLGDAGGAGRAQRRIASRWTGCGSGCGRAGARRAAWSRSRASRCAGTASWRCAGTPTAPQLQSRSRARAGAGDVQRAGRAARPEGRVALATGEAGDAVVLCGGRGVGGAAMSRFPLRYAHQNILVGEGDARAALFRRRHGLLSVPGGGGQARVAAAAGAVRVRGRGRLLAVAGLPRLPGRGLRRAGDGAARRPRRSRRRRGAPT